ncbi:MAG: class I SAM-dependent methyltransferase [Anaerolineales bacterium]|nr:class I SAM-dependent methyltransferase [Anaerolineales bacterium]
MELKKYIPAFLMPAAKKVYFLFFDMIDTLKGSRDSLTPPRSLIFVGLGDFKQIGNEFKKYFIELGGLKPDHRVLDIGCGIGRMAVPLTGYLTKEGGYWGFDIVKKGIDWCEKHITKEFDHFHFQHVNIYNKYYNKKGTIVADQFKFPYETGFFDFVFLTSVFTHMRPAELENYIKEIARVLKPGGKAVLTFFLLNLESKQLTEAGRSLLDFKHQITENCKTTNLAIPEDAIAYEENFALSIINKNQLTVDSPIHYGSWCGRENYLTFQDLVIVKK